MKILMLCLILVGFCALMYGLPWLYSIKKEVNNIKQRKTFYFVIANIIAAILFTVINISLFIFILIDELTLALILSSISACLIGIFVLIVCIVTKEIGKLIFIVNSLRNLDSFTKVYNRGYIESAILTEFNRCIRYKVKSCLMMIDINKFKQINDLYGHQAGDKVLLDLVNILNINVRKTDKVGRYGGDEFIVLMAETELKNAYELKQRIDDAVLKSIVTHDYKKIIYSISIGILEIDLNFDDYLQWINTVDSKLYESKNRKIIPKA